MELVLTGLWAEAEAAFPDLKTKIPKAIEQALLQEAHDLRKRMVSQFRAQAPIGGTWSPLSPMTLRARKLAGFGGTKILIRTSDLRNSIGVNPVSPGLVFVGVNRSAKSDKNKGAMADLVNLGELHEFGKVIKIKVTRKMQRFMFGVMLKTGKGRDLRGKFAKGGTKHVSKGNFKLGATIVIRIPARPFIGPAVNAMTPEQYEASIAERMAKLLNGKVGRP